MWTNTLKSEINGSTTRLWAKQKIEVSGQKAGGFLTVLQGGN